MSDMAVHLVFCVYDAFDASESFEVCFPDIRYQAEVWHSDVGEL